MKRNGIILVVTLIAMMFAGQVFGQDAFIVTASSPDATDGVIDGSSAFSIQINMDNDAVPNPDFPTWPTEWCGGNVSFKLYSPDNSIREITHVNASGANVDLFEPSVEYLNGLATMMNMVLMPLLETDFDGTLPDSIGFTMAGMGCMPASAELTAYIQLNIQIDYAWGVTEGTFCIDSTDDGFPETENSDWDWLFPEMHQPTSFNGPYCWTVINLTASDVKQIDQDNNVLPNDFSLEQNYPNPFNPNTTFDFALPRLSHVTIDIFNVLGQKIKTLADAEYPAGKYSVNWDGVDDNGSNVASGIYFYRMNAEDFQDTKKLMLLK